MGGCARKHACHKCTSHATPHTSHFTRYPAVGANYLHQNHGRRYRRQQHPLHPPLAAPNSPCCRIPHAPQIEQRRQALKALALQQKPSVPLTFAAVQRMYMCVFRRLLICCISCSIRICSMKEFSHHQQHLAAQQQQWLANALAWFEAGHVLALVQSDVTMVAL